MCMVSAVLRQGLGQWKDKHNLSPFTEYDAWKKWQKLVTNAKEYDKLVNKPDCEDPVLKSVFEKQVMERLEKLEKLLESKEV